MHSDISELKQLLRRIQRSAHGAPRPRVPSGCELDQLLPERGFARGSLVEWLSGASGSGASLLALATARQACREGGVLVVIDRNRAFYPPAAAARAIDLQSTIVVRPSSEKDEHWALDQALRCSHVAAVLAWPRRLDNRTFRRLQLAAETSGCLGLLVRTAQARTEPSWADVRLLVSSVGQVFNLPNSQAGWKPALRNGWRLRVEVLRCPGGLERGVVELEVDDQTGEIHETGARHLATKLAAAEADSHQARA